MWMTNELLSKIWVFLNEVRHPQSWRGHMRSFWEDFPFFMEQATCALIFFLDPSSQGVHNHHLVLRGKYPTQIGHHMWKIPAPKLAPTFGQHMEPPPQPSNANVTKNPTYLRYEIFICYFGLHDSGHHPTQNTFHSRRLPPHGSQTHQNIRWRPILGCLRI